MKGRLSTIEDTEALSIEIIDSFKKLEKNQRKYLIGEIKNAIKKSSGYDYVPSIVPFDYNINLGICSLNIIRDYDENNGGRITNGKINIEKSKIRYGKIGNDSFNEEYLFILSLKDLKKLDSYKIPWLYHEINSHTEARKTITGELKVRRIPEPERKRFNGTAKFSRDNYDTIKRCMT